MNTLRFSYSNTTFTTPGFWADVVTYGLENRIVTVCDGDDYRFGLKVLTEESVFNGMEKDNEMKGIGNSLDFGVRIYDSRIASFLSIDPLTKWSTWQSPYIFAGNSPIKYIDKNGEFKWNSDNIKAFPVLMIILQNAAKLYNNQQLPPEVSEKFD